MYGDLPISRQLEELGPLKWLKVDWAGPDKQEVYNKYTEKVKEVKEKLRW